MDKKDKIEVTKDNKDDAFTDFMVSYKELFTKDALVKAKNEYVNGKEITVEQLEEKKKEIEGQKGIKLVESGKDSFRTKIEG